MAEYFEVFNEDGESTGKLKLRSEVHRDGDWHRAVHVWILNDVGEILIQKRAEGKDTFPEKWDISCAGHLEPGEEASDGAVRELKEELGLGFDQSELDFLGDINVSTISQGGKVKDNEIEGIFMVRREVKIENLELQEEEVIAVKWANIDQVKSLIEIGEFCPHGDEYFGKLFDLLEG